LLSYFRINDPYRLLGLLVITIIIFIPFFIDPAPLTASELKSLVLGERLNRGFGMYSGLMDHTAPFTSWVQSAAYYLFGESILARHIFALVLILAQAAYLGIIFIDKKVFPESSFFPSLIFTILYVFSFDTLQLSGEMMGSFFLLVALNNLFKEMEFREESISLVLKIGFFIALASLFSLSFIVYIPGTLVILLLFTRSSGRKFSLLILGFLIPHLLVVGSYFIAGLQGPLWTYFYVPNLSLYSSSLVSFSSFFQLLILPLSFTVIAVLFLNRESRFTKYQSQLIQVMFFWMLFSVIQIAYSKDIRPQSFVLLIPSLAFFISHFILIIRKRKFAELSFWIFFAGMLLMSYYNRYNALENPGYERYVLEQPSISKGKRILVLSNEMKLYKDNHLATPFFNWELSKEIFEHPEYYENVVTVYNGFKLDLPETVIDPTNLFKPFLEKIPELKKVYIPTKDGYELIKQ
jgi:hypothetical protein